MQVDTPKANVQRRIYAADERVPEQAAAVPPGQYSRLPQRPTPTTQPGAPQPGAQGGNNNRIDPAQIPRQDAQTDAGRPWLTRTNLGQVPPPATSGFLVEDDGNASPRYMRLSLNQLIACEDHLKASAVPFGVVVQPLADVPLQEGAVPVVDCGDAGPIRCIRCRAYISPFFSFLDGGRSFQCNLCFMVNPTPSECFCELDQNGYRRDHAERPELCRGGPAPVTRRSNRRLPSPRPTTTT